ncbi:MAG: hypothetical protein M1828_002316 [Chrysothrix sp. TS-e1954]|nr:MAG: hypothetical protein M1828_002316 [Chrysothrix sp. TS-e1954]
MPPQSRGPRLGTHSKSTPNLSAINVITPISTNGETLISARDQRHQQSPAIAHELQERDNSANASDDDDGGSQSSFERDFLSPPSPTDSQSSSTASSNYQPLQGRPAAPGRTQSLYSHPSRSASYLGGSGPVAFAPPFYNRPPTPLPQTPSLTSLLRPPFSALPSRPTTPDSSDTEATAATGAQTTASAAVAHSARTATTVPRASPTVPTYEYYGFVLHLGSSLVFGLFLLWSYLPTPFLHQLGLYYYPDRWWSLAVPAWLVICVCYIFIALASYNSQWLTLDMTRIENLVDEKASVAIIDEHGRLVRDKGRRGGKNKHDGWGRLGIGNVGHKKTSSVGRSRAGSLEELDWRSLWNEGTDAVMDVPIGGVCEVLYGTDTESAPDDDHLMEAEDYFN